MKRLYLSDLDGTLFTTKKTLTENTVKWINECMESGALFAVATARMPYGCDYRLKELKLNAPSILTNGVFLYDFAKKEYVSVKTIPDQAANRVLDVFNEYETGVFLYTFAEKQISIYYNDPALVSQTQYYSDRAIAVCRTVAYDKDLTSRITHNHAFYFACTGSKEVLEPIKTAINKIEGIACAFYLNIYNGLYCMEIFSSRATKKNALLELKKRLQCDEIVVFGDNFNDLSMFEAADRSYAVENALDEVKKAATDVIPSCDRDGVARFMHSEIFGV